RALSINPSTCFNIMRTLAAEGIVDFNALSKTYTIGLGLVKLVETSLTETERVFGAKPLLQSLADQFHVTGTLWRSMGPDRIVLVFVEQNRGDLQISMTPGRRLPLLMGSSGRLFVAYSTMSKVQVRDAFRSVQWARPLSFDIYWKQV